MNRVLLKITFIGILLLGLAVGSIAAQEPCPGAPAPRLIGADSGQVAQSYSSLRAGLGSNVILRIMRTGQTFTIRGEPRCSGIHYWYPITFNGIDGWVTEGMGNSYWIQPVADVGTGGPLQARLGDPINDTTYRDPYTRARYTSASQCPDTPAPRLTPGQTVEVAQVYSNLRLGVHSDRILRTLRTGDDMVVVEGPFCTTRLNNRSVYSPYHWYLVEANGVRGWVTEGTGNSYWLRPVN